MRSLLREHRSQACPTTKRIETNFLETGRCEKKAPLPPDSKLKIGHRSLQKLSGAFFSHIPVPWNHASSAVSNFNDVAISGSGEVNSVQPLSAMAASPRRLGFRDAVLEYPKLSDAARPVQGTSGSFGIAHTHARLFERNFSPARALLLTDVHGRVACACAVFWSRLAPWARMC